MPAPSTTTRGPPGVARSGEGGPAFVLTRSVYVSARPGQADVVCRSIRPIHENGLVSLQRPETPRLTPDEDNDVLPGAQRRSTRAFRQRLGLGLPPAHLLLNSAAEGVTEMTARVLGLTAVTAVAIASAGVGGYLAARTSPAPSSSPVAAAEPVTTPAPPAVSETEGTVPAAPTSASATRRSNGPRPHRRRRRSRRRPRRRSEAPPPSPSPSQLRSRPRPIVARR